MSRSDIFGFFHSGDEFNSCALKSLLLLKFTGWEIPYYRKLKKHHDNVLIIRVRFY